MKALHLPAANAALFLLLALAPVRADAQIFPVAPPALSVQHGGMPGFHHGGMPGFHHGGRHGFHGGAVFVIQRDLVIEREIVREVPADEAAADPPPPAPRKPYVIGRSYSSLPGGCMKLIDGGKSYFLCSGEWYRQVRGSGGPYLAVAEP